MQLTQGDQDKVKQWLEARASSGLRCFVCGSANWSIQTPAAMTVSYDVHTTRIHYMQGYPMIALMCTQCAHMIWFNALVMGLQPDPPQETAPEPPSGTGGGSR